MMTLDQIRDALKDRRPAMVAQSTGLHVNTVMRIRDGMNTNPTYEVVTALSRYLQGKVAANG